MGRHLIERIYLKETPLFCEIELNLTKGLIVFSGASGAGKSLFMENLLSFFGLRDISAKSGEIALDNDLPLKEYGIESEEFTIIKIVKKEKSRYFINNQMASKKSVVEIFKNRIKHISLKECSEFDTPNLLEILDAIDGSAEHKKNLKSFRELYKKERELSKELKELKEKERVVLELKELARFEIDKIEGISPKIGEYEELMRVKKSLSKSEKIGDLARRSQNIFEYESSIKELLSLLDASYLEFEESMNNIRATIESAFELCEELSLVDVEVVLNRIEELSYLCKRYGGIEEALAQKDRKKEELKGYENIDLQVAELEDRVEKIKKELDLLASKITKTRVKTITSFEREFSSWLRKVLLRDGKIVLTQNRAFIGELGYDRASLKVNNTEIAMLSSGEFNRARLALIMLEVLYLNRDDSIIILDELDANLSGEESEGVAMLLKEISSSYQVFAISHQSHIPSLANMHFLVKKTDDKSTIIELDRDGKVLEIARMISGKEINQEAINFAKKKLEA